MYCPQCGKENLEGSKFCDGCGAPMGTAPQPTAEPVPQQAAEPVSQNVVQGVQNQAAQQQYGQQNGTYQQQYEQQPYAQMPYQAYDSKPPKQFDLKKQTGEIISGLKAIDGKVLKKVISVMLALLTIMTMMMGWAKTEHEYGDDNEYKETYNITQFKRIVGMKNKQTHEYLDEADNPTRKEEKRGVKLFVTNLLMIVDMLVAFLALLTLAAYIFAMCSGVKGANLVGMLGNILSVLAAVIFFAAMFVIDEKDLDMTLGLFMAFATALGNLIFMFVKKDELKA